jgi:membrane-associated phospholipid phosphatase
MIPRSVRHRRPQLDEAASRRHRLALAAAAGGGVALISAMVARLGVDEHWPIDLRVRAVVATHRKPKTRAMLRVAGTAGAVGVYVPATVLAVLLVSSRRDTRRAMPIAGAVTSAAIASWLLKHAVKRPRPRGTHGPVNSHPSFPSGHATRASATALTIAYVLLRERMAPHHVALPIAAGISAAAGVSRAYADAHWTTDVIGGWALGAATAAAAGLWYEHVRDD